MLQPEIPNPNENKVIVQSAVGSSPMAKRLLDLNNIRTSSLLILSPTAKEIAAMKVDARQALDDYANRLREGYKTNKEGVRTIFAKRFRQTRCRCLPAANQSVMYATVTPSGQFL